MKFTVLILLILVFFTSCFKEDEKVPKHDPGDVTIDTVELKKDYRYQVYYRLSDSMVVSTNLKDEYDLAFECGPDDHHILLNTATFMVAGNTGINDFSAPIDTTGLQWKFDKSDGNPDSTALGEWISFSEADSSVIYSQEIYVLQRGYDIVGNDRGLRKIVFTEVTETSYSFRYANLDGSNENLFTVIKDPTVNHVFFTFDDGGKQMNLEPPKDDWDLLFTQYTTLLFTDIGEPYPYLLTGVLSNLYRITVAQDSLLNFTEVTIDDVSGMDFTANLDEIGYDWKDVEGDVTSGNVNYVIIPKLYYVIRDNSGYHYKLRFTSFYSSNGEKGYPVFEYQLL